ncbi:amidase family protein [Streptomyces sp. TG1A-60]|uniref:amidase family protein n=1 Tax=Streptomyces sp. TG1A-60 TaxID=3129111 RepID=UPI0030CB2939
MGGTHNPRDRAATHGGPSGGAPVAAPIGVVPLAQGNDIAGSLQTAVCGAVGLRPAAGTVPTWHRGAAADDTEGWAGVPGEGRGTAGTRAPGAARVGQRHAAL